MQHLPTATEDCIQLVSQTPTPAKCDDIASIVCQVDLKPIETSRFDQNRRCYEKQPSSYRT